MDSILDFWNQMTANPLLFVAVTLTLGVILVNGWTDAPNAIATCVVTRCMAPRAALWRLAPMPASTSASASARSL